MPKLHTLKQFQRELSKERFDLTGYRLIVEDKETSKTFTVEAVELDKEVRTAVIVIKKE